MSLGIKTVCGSLTAGRIKQKLAKYEFLDQAALHWPTHVREGERDNVNTRACKFLNNFPGQFQSWYQISFLLRNSEVNHDSRFTGIHAAGLWGLFGVTRLLIDRGADIEAKDSDNWTALHYATLNGNMEIIKQPLEEGANINTDGSEYRNALQAAAYIGKETLVPLLLERQTGINMQTDRYGDSLQLGCIKGHVGVRDRLLRAGADPNMADLLIQKTVAQQGLPRFELTTRFLCKTSDCARVLNANREDLCRELDAGDHISGYPKAFHT